MKVIIDQKNKKVIIELALLESPVLSSSGDTSAIAERINNQGTGEKFTDGREIKVSANVYVKTPKV